MARIISLFFIATVCSLYYFPVSLRALPSINSKMVVAFAGLLFFIWEHVKYRRHSIRGELFPVLCLGMVYSLWSFFSVVYNSTDDMVFVSYFVSMSVWLGGAYCVIYLLKCRYGYVALDIVFLYVALVCAGQCVLALLIDHIPEFKDVVDVLFVGPDKEYFEHNPRLYGIGAGFDTAGIRLSCALLGIAFLIRNALGYIKLNFYIVLFLIIGIVGNMISRTTVVGIVVALCYLFLTSSFLSWKRLNVSLNGILWAVGLCIGILILFNVVIYIYNNMPDVRRNLDYGFEGFINWYETGSFSTHSSDLLLNSIGDILPSNAKTWLIGDGYFADPYDPGKFYMGTDMGYIRIIFYCGLIGLSVFLMYFICCTYVLCRRERSMNMFFICLFVIQLIVWIKIPTDIFCYYALLLLADKNSSEIKYDLNL